MARAGLAFDPSLVLSVLCVAAGFGCSSESAGDLGGPEVEPPEVMPPATDACSEQRSPEATGHPLDVAALAPAYIALQNRQYVDSARLTVDAEGFVVTESGERVVGFLAASGFIETLRLPLEIPARATEVVRAAVVLTTYRAGENPGDAGAPVVSADDFDPDRPSETSFFSFTVEVFDTLGRAQPVEVYFSRIGARDFAFRAVVPSQAISPLAPEGGTVIGSGLLLFEEDGQLRFKFSRPAGVQFWGSEPQVLQWDFALPSETAAESTFAAGGPSRVVRVQSDGHPNLAFSEITVDGFGWVLARYGDDVWEAIGQIAVAKPAVGCEDISPPGMNAVRTLVPEAETPPTLGWPGTTGFERLLPGVRWKSVGLDVPVPEARCDGLEAIEMSMSDQDLALSGAGYLVLAGSGYARALRAERAADGRLTAPDGTALLGFPAETPEVLGPLFIPSLQAPVATQLIGATVKLSTDAPIQEAGTFDPERAAETSFWSTDLTVLDSLGREHPVSVYFSRIGTRRYAYAATVDTSRLAASTSTGTRAIFAEGQLGFASDGRLESHLAPARVISFFGAGEQTVTWQFGSPLSEGGDGSGSSAGPGPSEARLLTPDGFPVGQLNRYRIDTDGRLSATYDSARQIDLGALAVARVADPCGELGWPDTYGIQALEASTATPTAGRANQGGRGQIIQGAVLTP